MPRGIRVIPDRWLVVIEDDNSVRALGPHEKPTDGATVFELRPLPLDIKQAFVYAAVRGKEEKLDAALLSAASAIIVSVEGLLDQDGNAVEFDPDMIKRGSFELADIDALVSWVLAKEMRGKEAQRKNANSGSTPTPRPSSGNGTTDPGAVTTASRSDEPPETSQLQETTAERAS